MFAEVDHQGSPIGNWAPWSGAVAGLVAVTPAAGYAVDGPPSCSAGGRRGLLFFCTVVKNSLGYDDALDVFASTASAASSARSGNRHPGEPGARGSGIMDYTIG